MAALHWLDTLAQDVRYALRTLKNSRGFAAVAILSLALGIGANTAIFGLVDAVILKYLPVEQPQELLQVKTGDDDSFTNPMWEQLRDRQDVFSGVFAWFSTQFNLAPGGEVHYAQGVYTSGDFFRTLGLQPVLGRLYTPADDRRGCGGVAVLSYDFWQRHYAGDGAIVGKKISLGGHPFEILGVVRPGFHGVDVGRKFDVAAPICSQALTSWFGSMLDQRRAWWLRVIGRPKPGLGSKQVTARLKILAPQILQATLPRDYRADEQQEYLHQTFETRPAANGLSYLRTEYSRALFTLMAVAGVVLLIACANIANLLLARTSARQREIAVRLAIGASRARLIRQLLTESVLLSFIGAVLGSLLASWGSTLLVRYFSLPGSPVFLDLAVNLRILVFTTAVAVATAILFGVTPALRATRIPLHVAMKENTRGITGGRMRLGLGKALVISQVALSLLLLIGAGLLSGTLWKLISADAGFERENVLTVAVEPRSASIFGDRLNNLYDQMLEKVQTLPGVRSASRSQVMPISGSTWSGEIQTDFYMPASREDSRVYFNRVSPRFFETLGTPILAGRDFDAHDSVRSNPVAMINQALAKKFFHGMDPTGKPFRNDKSGAMLNTEVIGVVKDAKYRDLREAMLPTVYLPIGRSKDLWGSNTFEIRTSGLASRLIPAVKDALEGTSREINLEFGSLAVQVNESLSRERLLATLSAFFSALALLLASIGLYGVMSYTVARKRNEIGIRMALGAEQHAILWMVLREVLLLVAAGMATGFVAAIATTRLIASMLYGLTATDPVTMGVAGAVLGTVAALSGFLPARRAAQLDPMTTLREE